MDTVFLPGNIRQRLLDLMKHNNVSQTELARKIGCNDSLLSRFLSEKTDKLGDENIIRIARAFNVSTDFLLGVTTVPDRKNYEIDELGLSAQAARNLYTGKANAQVVNYLLESPRFLELTYILEQYFNDTVAAGYAAQNQLYATLSSLTRKSAKTKAAAQAANEINRLKTPVYQADLVTIENQFMMAVKEVKKEIGNDFAAIRAMTAEEAEKMFSEITKCQDMENLTVTPKQVSDLIIGSVAGMDCVDPDALNTLGEALTGLFQSTFDNAASREKDDEQAEQ
ncbi:MAG: helix-turn-helix domain-containing protein [Oscillospiraceae bacterium]